MDMGRIGSGLGQHGRFRTRRGPGQIGQGIEGRGLIVQTDVGVDSESQ